MLIPLAGAVLYLGLSTSRFTTDKPAMIALRVISDNVLPDLAARARSLVFVTSLTLAVAIELLACGFLGLLIFLPPITQILELVGGGRERERPL